MTESIERVGLDPELRASLSALGQPMFDEVAMREILDRVHPGARVSMVGDWMPGHGYALLIDDQPVVRCLQAAAAYDAVRILQMMVDRVRDNRNAEL